MEQLYPFKNVIASAYKNIFEHLIDISLLMRFAVNMLADPQKAMAGQSFFEEGLRFISSREEITENDLPFAYVRRQFGLCEFENICLMLSIAAEIDELIGSALYKLRGSRVPAFGTAVDIFSLYRNVDENVFASMQRQGVLSYLFEDSAEIGLSTPLNIRREAFDFIIGELSVNEPDLTLYSGDLVFQDLYPLEKEQVVRFALKKLSDKERCLIISDIKDEFEALSFLRHACRELGKKTLFIKPSDNTENLQELANKAVCIGVLTESLLAVFAGKSNKEAHKLIEMLPASCRLAFLCDSGKEHRIFKGFSQLKITHSPISRSTCMQIWEHFGNKLDIDAPLLANRYNLSAGQIFAITNAVLNQKASKEALPSDMELIKYEVGKQNTATDLTRIIHPSFELSDLIVDKDTKEELEQICLTMRHMPKLFEEYGYGKLFPYGRGLGVLFHGISGTGKTMAVQALARELGLDVMVADISRIIDKYIGETEKHLTEVFDKAKENNCVLFFDEADSLFSKRTDVGDSHDRHANAQTAHLLQKMEDYGGIVVLATNLLDNVDDAFKRRLPFIVGFSCPNEELRKLLWQRFIPPEIATEDLDFEYLGSTFDLTPAVIKWSALSAGVKAQSTGKPLSMEHIFDALRYEYKKMGIVFPNKPFGNIIL